MSAVGSAVFVAGFIFGSFCWANPRLEVLFSLQEFEQLAVALAPKVDLFAAVWEIDPNAEFFAGTSRDYVYWLRGHFKQIKSRQEALAKRDELMTLERIEARRFLIGESDVDMISSQIHSFNIERYGLKSVDLVSARRLDPSTNEGKSERDEGFIPTEKIRLSKKGIMHSEGLGNGFEEIYHARPTVTFSSPEVFAQSEYAKAGKAHEVRLALRFLRILAMNYYHVYGKGFPDKTTLFDIDQESAAQTQKAIDRAFSGESEFFNFIRRPAGKKRIDDVIKKLFRSYTNPTAAYELCKHFGVDRLVGEFGLEPINQYLFAKDRDARQVAENRKLYNIPAGVIVNAASRLPDLTVLHGVRREENYRPLLLQGVLESENGTAGRGVYVVTPKNLKFASDWARSKDRVVQSQISANAAYIDVNEGPGKKLFEEFAARSNTLNRSSIYDDFCDFFGIDIIKYSYDVDAYAVKNSSVLSHFQGLTRKILTVSEIADLARKAKTPIEQADVLNVMAFNMLPADEKDKILPLFIPADRLSQAIPESERQWARDYGIQAARYLYSLAYIRAQLQSGDLARQLDSEINKIVEKNADPRAPQALRGPSAT